MKIKRDKGYLCNCGKLYSSASERIVCTSQHKPDEITCSMVSECGYTNCSHRKPHNQSGELCRQFCYCPCSCREPKPDEDRLLSDDCYTDGLREKIIPEWGFKYIFEQDRLRLVCKEQRNLTASYYQQKMRGLWVELEGRCEHTTNPIQLRYLCRACRQSLKEKYLENKA